MPWDGFTLVKVLKVASAYAKRHPESRASFEEVASFLQGDWLMAHQQKLMQERGKIFAGSYEVIIESGDDEPD